MLSAIVFISPDEVHFCITGLAVSASPVTLAMGDIAHSLIACDFPVVGGPMKIEYMLSGISCVAVFSVVAVPAMNAVVVIRMEEA